MREWEKPLYDEKKQESLQKENEALQAKIPKNIEDLNSLWDQLSKALQKNVELKNKSEKHSALKLINEGL